MNKIPLIIILIFIMLFSVSAFGKQTPCESAVSSIIEVPKMESSINNAIKSIPKIPTGNMDPVKRVRILVDDGVYTYHESVTIDKPCIELVSKNDKKATIYRDEQNEYESPVIAITAGGVLVRGFKVSGEYDYKKAYKENRETFCNSAPAGIQVLSPDDHIPGTEYEDINIENNEIYGIGADYTQYYDLNCKDKKGKDLHVNSYGILIKSNNALKITHPHISTNSIHDMRLGRSEALVVSGNVSNFTVSDNKMWNLDNIGIDIIGHAGKKKYQASSGIIKFNEVYDLKNGNPGQSKAYPYLAGIYVDGGTGIGSADDEKIIVEKNTVRNFGVGIAVGSEKDDELVQFVDIKNNILFDNLVSGIYLGKSEPEQKSKLKDCRVFNNTLYGNGKYFFSMNETPLGELHLGIMKKDALRKISIYDNIVYAIQTQAMVRLEGSKIKYVNADFQGNYFYSPSTISFHWQKDGKSVVLNFFDFNKLFKDTNFKDDPQFISVNSSDKDFLKLKPGSPAKGKGAQIP